MALHCSERKGNISSANGRKNSYPNLLFLYVKKSITFDLFVNGFHSSNRKKSALLESLTMPTSIKLRTSRPPYFFTAPSPHPQVTQPNGCYFSPFRASIVIWNKPSLAWNLEKQSPIVDTRGAPPRASFAKRAHSPSLLVRGNLWFRVPSRSMCWLGMEGRLPSLFSLVRLNA